MNGATSLANRSRVLGWMRPSVGKVGAVQTGTGVIAVAAMFSGVSWPWWAVAFAGYFFYACVGHSVGYHRYFAHRSFPAPRWAQVLFTVAGTLGCVGSPVGWAQMHHRHHRYSDREGDPYTAHRYPYPTAPALMMGGYGAVPGSARALRRMLRADRLQMFVMRYYFGIVAGFAGALLLVDWRWFVFGWAVPVAWTLWMAGLDAWATHRHGYRNHDTPDASRNLWWCSLLSWGEGWHNNHHANPRAWSYREKWWEWDPGAAVVWLILRMSKAEEPASGGAESGGAAARAGSGGRARGSRGAGLCPRRWTVRSGIGLRRSSVQRLGSLVLAAMLLAVPVRSVEAMADIMSALRHEPPRDPIALGRPALSPDGRLAALGVSVRGDYSVLVIFDIDEEEMRIVDKPDDEGWQSPSFSPSGDALAFVRFCRSCATKGFQVSILDLKTGRTSTLTKGSDLFRYNLVFSPDGKYIAYSSDEIEWRGDRFDKPRNSDLRMITLATGQEREISFEGTGTRYFVLVSPGGFLDEDTLVFTAIGPGPRSRSDTEGSPLFRKLKSMVGEEDARFTAHGYKYELGRKVEFISPDAPAKVGEISLLSVSSDTGRMAYVAISGPVPSDSRFSGYDVFVGDGETFRQATRLFTYMAQDTAISKSGNRVAFLADDTRKRHWSLWVLELATGRVWETSLKRQLQEGHRALGEG